MYFGVTALVLSLLAAIPSAAAFTPAVFASLFALLIAAIGVLRGAWRLGLATLIVVTITVVFLSPLTEHLLRARVWQYAMILITPFALFALALVRYWQKGRSR
ncbi:MAG: hypothetical protein AB8G17_16460 [Gammaproteobacteria bacterium]